MTSRARSFLVLLLLFGAVPLRAAPTTDYKTPDKNWYKGPVRWLLSDDEEKAFKKLDTDEQRAAFIKEFWAKRDPTPGTPGNEFEYLFWKRVEDADKSFKSMTTAGSLNDQGRVLILLGTPSKSETDARGYIHWTYDADPAIGFDQTVTLRFARGQLSPLLLDRKLLETLVEKHPAFRGIGWKIPVVAQQAPEAGVPSAPTLPVQEDTSPESQRQVPILEGLLNQGRGPGEVPISVGFDSYAAADGTTLEAITVEVPRDAAHGSGSVALQPFARLVPVDSAPAPEGGMAPRAVNITGEHPFTPAPAEELARGGFVYQARRNLVPGTYKVAIAVEDKVMRGQMGTSVQTITVPDYRPKEFTTSSIALLSGFERVDSTPGPDEAAQGPGAFVLGSFRLVPRPSAIFTKDEALNFYYQVYNPTLDAASGRPELQVTYQFQIKDGAAWKPFRKALVKPIGQVELFSIDLKDLLVPNQPLPAEFKLEITVTDVKNGASAHREVAFTVR
jgi:GWxTD domain-containing protein